MHDARRARRGTPGRCRRDCTAPAWKRPGRDEQARLDRPEGHRDVGVDGSAGHRTGVGVDAAGHVDRHDDASPEAASRLDEISRVRPQAAGATDAEDAVDRRGPRRRSGRCTRGSSASHRGAARPPARASGGAPSACHAVAERDRVDAAAARGEHGAAHSASPPLLPEPTSSTTPRPDTPPRTSREQARARRPTGRAPPAASAPLGDAAERDAPRRRAPARRAQLDHRAPRACAIDERDGHVSIMAERQVPCVDAERRGRRPHGAGQREHRLAERAR